MATKYFIPSRFAAACVILLMTFMSARAETGHHLSYPIFGEMLRMDIAAKSLVGDVNGDGKVNVADVMLMVRYIIHDDMGETSFSLQASDINKDGQTNVSDVMIVVGIILGNRWEDPDNPTLILDDDEGRDPSGGL